MITYGDRGKQVKSEGHRFVSRQTVKCHPRQTKLIYFYFFYLFIKNHLCDRNLPIEEWRTTVYF